MYRLEVIGNLTNDPRPGKEFRGEPSANFSIAANNARGGKKITEYFTCSAYDTRAKFALEYLHKGNTVYVEGDPRVYVGSDGKAHFSLNVRSIESMSGKRASPDSGREEVPAHETKRTPEAEEEEIDVTEEFLRSGRIVTPPTPEPVENVKLPWDDGSGDESDLPF